MMHADPPRRALLHTALLFGTVGLAWLLLASFLPNFHLADTSLGARALFIGIVLLLLTTILVAQLAMLRTWFASITQERPARAAEIRRLRWVILLLIALGIGGGVAVLWYATAHWMPRVQQAVERGSGEPAAPDLRR